MKNIKTQYYGDKAANYFKNRDETSGNVAYFSDLCSLFSQYDKESDDIEYKEVDLNFNKDELIINIPFFRMVIDSITDIIVFLDNDRRIILANKAFCDLACMDHHKITGLRLGEALGCVHAYEEEEDCGATRFCRECGAAKAISSGLADKFSVQECRIIPRQDRGDALDLKVKSLPFKVQGVKYIFLAVTDISHEKRRRALERIFFHDILNLTGNILGLIELITSGYIEKREEYEKLLLKTAQMLVEEIHSHRILFAAESNMLTLDITILDTMDILYELQGLYENHYVAKNKNLRIDDSSVNIRFESDKSLLVRVLGNMIKNAFEASEKGATITMGCGRDGNMVMFRVNNPGVMPRHISLQIFQRSFSTKGKGRGLGTYSIRLLTERYLKGIATFSTSEVHGTTFRVFYPVRFHEDDDKDN